MEKYETCEFLFEKIENTRSKSFGTAGFWGQMSIVTPFLLGFLVFPSPTGSSTTITIVK